MSPRALRFHRGDLRIVDNAEALVVLEPVETRINPVRLREQGEVRSFLNQPAMIEHDDMVGMDHSREAMGDDDCRSILHDPGQRFLHAGFRLVVESRGRFVQHEDRRIADNSACDRKPLALAARQGDAVFADQRVVAVYLRTDEIIRLRLPGRQLDLFVRGVGAAVPYIVADRPLEQVGLLRDISDGVAQRLCRDGRNILPVDRDHAAIEIVEALQKCGQG